MKYLALFCFFVSGNAVAQKEANILYFGSACIDFNTQPPASNLTSAMNSLEAAASICDSNGVLQFYSNGGSTPTGESNGTIWNRDHQIMENGVLIDTGGCYSSFRGALIIPVPGKQRKYYLFARDCVEHNFSPEHYNRGLTYSIIDMSQNNGLGKVITKGVKAVYYGKDISLSGKTNNESVSAALHSNGRDYWIYSYIKDTIYTLLVDTSGLHPYRLLFKGGGKILVSPKQNYIAFGKELYNLNTTNGDITNNLVLASGELEFSPNGRYLYMVLYNKLYQYDLEANDILSSKTLITTKVLPYLSLAPDGVIYNWEPESDKLECSINCPNEPGVNCSFQLKGIDLKGRSTRHGFTNIFSRYLYKDNLVCNEPPTSPSLRDTTINSLECILSVSYPSLMGSVIINYFNNWKSQYKIHINDVIGRLILELPNLQSRQLIINSEDMATGVYMVTLSVDADVHCTKKMVVVK